MTPTVHILWRGAVLCGSLHGIPRNWGNVARWIGANDPNWSEHATCAVCREQAALLELNGSLAQLIHDIATRRRYPLGVTVVTVKA